MVGDEQRAAVGGHVLDPLDLGPEPVAIEELVQGPVHHPLDALRAPPVVELPIGLDRGQQVAHHLAGMALREPLARLGLLRLAIEVPARRRQGCSIAGQDGNSIPTLERGNLDPTPPTAIRAVRPEAGPDPGRRTGPLRQPRSGVAADRLAPAPPHVDVRRQGRPCTTPRWGRPRTSRTRWRSSSSTGSRAAGRTGSRTSPTSPAATGCSRSTCPGSAPPRPRLGDLDPRLRPAAARVLRRGRRPRLRRGRQLDGRLRRHRGGDRAARAGSRSSSSSPPPGCRARGCAASPPRWPRG